MYDPALSHSLKYNIAEFSAFKETSFRKQLEAALTSNGKVTPWSEFKKKADELNVEYNRRWLKTEYDHTVATANMTQQWQDFEADADLYPNLKYVTAGDARVRDEHKILDGLILPINHSFWKTHTTPLDWGCRCNIEQTDEDVSETIPDFKVKKEFQNNPFYSGKVFVKDAYFDGLSGAEVKEASKQAKRNFEEKEYKTFELPFKGKGKILSSNLVDVEASDYNDVLACCKHFAKMGKATELLPRVDFDSPLYSKIYKNLIGTKFEKKCPDFKVNGLFYELEGFDITKNSNPVTTLKNMLSRGLKQSNKIIIKDCGVTRSFLERNIKNRVFIDKQDIQEVWFLDDKGKLGLIYNAKTS